VYRVEYYCPRQDPSRWFPDSTNPYFILQNAIRRCNALMWQFHAARVIGAGGQVLYQV
jgi:hypothetical protein